MLESVSGGGLGGPQAKVELSFSLEDPAFQSDHFRCSRDQIDVARVLFCNSRWAGARRDGVRASNVGGRLADTLLLPFLCPCRMYGEPVHRRGAREACLPCMCVFPSAPCSQTLSDAPPALPPAPIAASIGRLQGQAGKRPARAACSWHTPSRRRRCCGQTGSCARAVKGAA